MSDQKSNMTFAEFKKKTEATYLTQAYQREGQWAFNSLYDVDPILANRVRAVDELDPFHNTARLPVFWKFVEENWTMDVKPTPTDKQPTPTEYEVLTTAVVVVQSGYPIFHESATKIVIDDEAGGEYVTVTQTWPSDKGIAIDPAEWPTLRTAIDQMVGKCRG